MNLSSETQSSIKASDASDSCRLIPPVSMDTIEYGNPHSPTWSEDGEVTLIGMDPVVPTPYPPNEVVWSVTIEAIVFGQGDIGEVIIIHVAPTGCVLGRSSLSTKMQRKDVFCSKDHALFSINPAGTLLISDLDSKNGTFLNGVRITQSALSQGDEIRVGKTFLRLLGIHREPIKRVQLTKKDGEK